MGLSRLKCFSNEPTEGHYSQIVLNKEQMSPWTAVVSPEVSQHSLYFIRKKVKAADGVRFEGEAYSGDTLYSRAYYMKM